MMDKIFDMDGPVIGFFEKMGQLIVLSVFWLIGCIPIVTICTSSAALYYAVCKSVRFGQGSPIREFWKSYRANLLRGGAIGLMMLVVLGGMEYLSAVLQGNMFPTGAFGTIVVFALFLLMYIGPVLSRFRGSISKVIKLSFVMSLQYAHYTVLFLVGTVLLALGALFIFPMPTMLFLPGVWCWVTTFLMEKVLRKYMPAKSEDDEEWYYDR